MTSFVSVCVRERKVKNKVRKKTTIDERNRHLLHRQAEEECSCVREKESLTPDTSVRL